MTVALSYTELYLYESGREVTTGVVSRCTNRTNEDHAWIAVGRIECHGIVGLAVPPLSPAYYVAVDPEAAVFEAHGEVVCETIFADTTFNRPSLYTSLEQFAVNFIIVAYECYIFLLPAVGVGVEGLLIGSHRRASEELY